MVKEIEIETISVSNGFVVFDAKVRQAKSFAAIRMSFPVKDRGNEKLKAGVDALVSGIKDVMLNMGIAEEPVGAPQ